MLEKKSDRDAVVVGSDFSGVGAFNQALDLLGIDYRTVFACDLDKFARQTYIANYGEPEYYPEDVYDRDIPADPLDIYMTSPPCQAFSYAGKREGENDERGLLFYNSHEFIVKNKPRYFIFENVRGLLSDDGGRTFQRWVDMLGGKTINGNPVLFPHQESVPYHIYHKVLNSKDYNVPQTRDRVFIVGIRDDTDNNFSWPMAVPLTKSLKDILEDEVNQKYYLSQANLKSMIVHKKRHDSNGSGFGVVLKEDDDIACTIRANGALCRTDNHILIKSGTMRGFDIAEEGDSINFSQVNSKTRRGRVGKKIAQTIDTKCNQATMVAHYILADTRNSQGKVTSRHLKESLGTAHCSTGSVGNMDQYVVTNKYGFRYRLRRLTPRECFRAMDFPDTFHWPVSDSQAYKQAGNSIVRKVLADVISKFNL